VQDISNTNHTNFVKFNNEIQSIVDEINNHKRALDFGSLFRKGPKSKTALNGGIVVSEGAPEQVHEWVKALEKTPADTSIRLQLVASLFKLERKYDLETLRNILIQATIPVLLGEVNTNILNLYAQVYGLYLTKVCNDSNQQIKETRLSALDDASLEKVEVPLSPAKRRKIELLEIDAKVAAELLEQNSKWSHLLRKSLVPGYSDSLLDHLISGSTGGGVEIHSSHYDQIVTRTAGTINLIKTVPMFYFKSLATVEKIKRLDPRSPYAFLLEGRLHMQRTKYLEIRIRYGDQGCIPQLTSSYNKTIVAYRKGVRLVPSSNVQKKDLPILSEFANATYYGYVLRPLMKLSTEGVQDLVLQGMAAVEKAMLLDSRMLTLKTHLMSALEGLSGKSRGAKRAALGKKKRRKR